MMKLVEFQEYRSNPVEDSYTTIYVNPNKVIYIYAVKNAGLDMTVLVFMEDFRICVLGNMDKIRKTLEGTEE